MKIYNNHIHAFNIKDIPDRFLGWVFMKLLTWNKSFDVLAKILHKMNPFSDKDEFDRYLAFAKTGRMKTLEEIFLEVYDQYPKDTVFNILTMDMAYMGAGKVPRTYQEQLDEVSALVRKYPDNLMSFVHIDPRRDGYSDLFKRCIEQNGFKGLKLYPPLGIFPYDPRYKPVYEYCNKNKLPLVAHCTDGNPVHWKGSHDELVRLLEGSKLPVNWNQKDKELCSYFTHPSNYEEILSAYPDMNICLAHFGRETEWDIILLQMMDKYPNLWCDISYSMSDEKHWPMLKVRLATNPVLLQRCLYGTDFYMVQIECTEKEFAINLRAFLGEELFTQLSYTNPQKFLGISQPQPAVKPVAAKEEAKAKLSVVP
jgi:uncharacterized protein